MGTALLALPFGLLIGLSLGLVGGGGSILAVPVLVYVLGENVHAATTASLLIVGSTALVAGLDQARNQRVRWSIALLVAAAGAAGALVGTAFNRRVRPEVLLLAFAVILLAAAYGMLQQRGDDGRAAEEVQGIRLLTRALPAGLLVGALTGFFGVGGGFVIVPVLVLLLRLRMSVAIGTSLIIIALTSAAALVAHLSAGGVRWQVALPFTAAAITGALVGSRLSERLSGPRLKQLFAVLVVLVAAYLLVRNVPLVV